MGTLTAALACIIIGITDGDTLTALRAYRRRRRTSPFALPRSTHPRRGNRGGNRSRQPLAATCHQPAALVQPQTRIATAARSHASRATALTPTPRWSARAWRGCSIGTSPTAGSTPCRMRREPIGAGYGVMLNQSRRGIGGAVPRASRRVRDQAPAGHDRHLVLVGQVLACRKVLRQAVLRSDARRQSASKEGSRRLARRGDSPGSRQWGFSTSRSSRAATTAAACRACRLRPRPGGRRTVSARLKLNGAPTRTKSFSVRLHGGPRAYALAVKARLAMLGEAEGLGVRARPNRAAGRGKLTADVDRRLHAGRHQARFGGPFMPGIKRSRIDGHLVGRSRKRPQGPMFARFLAEGAGFEPAGGY